MRRSTLPAIVGIKPALAQLQAIIDGLNANALEMTLDEFDGEEDELADAQELMREDAADIFNVAVALTAGDVAKARDIFDSLSTDPAERIICDAPTAYAVLTFKEETK